MSEPMGLVNQSPDEAQSAVCSPPRREEIERESSGRAAIFGTKSPAVTVEVFRQLLGVSPRACSSVERACEFALHALRGIGPKDQVEGLLAVQMLATHNLAMEFMSRAAHKDQTTEGTDLISALLEFSTLLPSKLRNGLTLTKFIPPPPPQQAHSSSAPASSSRVRTRRS